MEPRVSGDIPNRPVHRSSVLLHVVGGGAGVPDDGDGAGSGDHVLPDGDGPVLLAAHGAEVSDGVCGSEL